MTTENTDTNHRHEFSTCWRIICAVTIFGGGDHHHCKVCDVAASKVPIPTEIRGHAPRF